jgi:hypothetical protein
MVSKLFALAAVLLFALGASAIGVFGAWRVGFFLALFSSLVGN